MNICIIIPAHNEAVNLGPVVCQIRDRHLHVTVIDDGSADATGQVAREAGAFVIRNDERSGKGYSLKRGFKYALQGSFDGVITMDGDGQHDPSHLDEFLKTIEADPKNVITGNRMNNTEKMPLLRHMTNRIMSGLISFICKQSIPDSQCGFRYIPIDILKQLNLTSNDYEIESEVLIKSCRLGHQVHSIPIKTIYRNEESKIRPIRDTFRFLRYLFWEMIKAK